MRNGAPSWPPRSGSEARTAGSLTGGSRWRSSWSSAQGENSAPCDWGDRGPRTERPPGLRRGGGIQAHSVELLPPAQKVQQPLFVASPQINAGDHQAADHQQDCAHGISIHRDSLSFARSPVPLPHRDPRRRSGKPRFFHGHAGEMLGDLHGGLIVGDEQKLYPLGHFLDQLAEAAHIRFVKGASTSSSRQKGAGFSSKMANTRAAAVRAFSPPDKRWMELLRLPGGRAMMRTPASGESRSMSSRLACPPPNSLGNMRPRPALIRSKVSWKRLRHSRSIRSMAPGGWSRRRSGPGAAGRGTRGAAPGPGTPPAR